MQGVRSGELTPAERRRLEARERKLRKDEAKAKADGSVTPAERARLQREANRDSRAIEYAKDQTAILAAEERTTESYSLSPTSLTGLPKGARLVLPSPNGATLSLRAAALGTTVAACLRNARAVAEFCLMNALILLRRSLYFTDANPARKSFYAPDSVAPASETLYDKTVGLIGFGNIGRLFRKLLEPFGCRVLVNDPYLSAEDALAARKGAKTQQSFTRAEG